MNVQENKRYFLKSLLIVQTVGVVIYTVLAIQNDGVNFLERAQEFAVSMKWIGQFTVDFNCYLILSALWILWRNKYSANSIIIALIAMLLGIIVFAPYLLYLLIREKGDLKKVLISAER
ncbi:MAG: hypothetical protein WA913_11070 [Pricia sp.]